MSFEQGADAVEVVDGQRLAGKVHIGHVEIELADALIAASTAPLGKNTGKTKQTRHDQRQDKGPQGRTTAAPKPKSLRCQGFSCRNGLASDEPAKVQR